MVARQFLFLFLVSLFSMSVSAASLSSMAEDVYDAVVSSHAGSIRVASLYKRAVPTLKSLVLKDIDKEVDFHAQMKGGAAQIPGYSKAGKSAAEKRKYLRNWWILQSFSFDQFNNKTSRKIMSARLNGQGAPMKNSRGEIIVDDHLAGMSNGERMQLFLLTWMRYRFQTNIALQGDKGFINDGYKDNYIDAQKNLLRIAYSMDGIDGKSSKGKARFNKLIEGLTQ